MATALECFLRKPAEAFTPSAERPCLRGLNHLPAIDGVYIPTLPLGKLLKDGRFNREVDVIMGSELNEGFFLSTLIMPDKIGESITLQSLEGFIAADLKRRFPDVPDFLMGAMTREALGTYLKRTTHDGLAEAHTMYFGDSSLLWPFYSLARGLRGQSNQFCLVRPKVT